MRKQISMYASQRILVRLMRTPVERLRLSSSGEWAGFSPRSLHYDDPACPAVSTAVASLRQ